jgi:hypothetical protein
MGAEAAAIAAAQATIANAIKASGAVVRVEPEDFARILGKTDKPLVVYAQGGLISTSHQYLVSYKGLVFFTKSSDQIVLPRGTELIRANKIWIPG